MYLWCSFFSPIEDNGATSTKYFHPQLACAPYCSTVPSKAPAFDVVTSRFEIFYRQRSFHSFKKKFRSAVLRLRTTKVARKLLVLFPLYRPTFFLRRAYALSSEWDFTNAIDHFLIPVKNVSPSTPGARVRRQQGASGVTRGQQRQHDTDGHAIAKSRGARRTAREPVTRRTTSRSRADKSGQRRSVASRVRRFYSAQAGKRLEKPGNAASGRARRRHGGNPRGRPGGEGCVYVSRNAFQKRHVIPEIDECTCSVQTSRAPARRFWRSAALLPPSLLPRDTVESVEWPDGCSTPLPSPRNPSPTVPYTRRDRMLRQMLLPFIARGRRSGIVYLGTVAPL